MNFFNRAVIACTLCMVLASCGLVKRMKKEKADENPERPDSNLIGVVELVNPEQKFVLIRTESRMSVAVGQEITAVDALGVESKLKVTPEKKPHYLTADILDGVPKTGSLVIHRKSNAAAGSVPNPPPSTPVTPDLVPLPSAPDQPPPLTPTGAVIPSPIPEQAKPSESVPTIEPALPPVVR